MSRAGARPVHVPVLFQAVLDGLNIRPGGRYIDATVGAGGHAAGILEAQPDVRLLGLDRDPAMLEVARERLSAYGARVVLVHGSFADLSRIAREHGFVPADGVLADLGLSSLHLADASRGFSFQHAGPLDMRFDRTSGALTAEDLVNTLPIDELAALLYRYGEESQAHRVAEAIGRARPLHTTVELAEVVAQALGRAKHPAHPHQYGWRGAAIHPATRTFQALRIAVNDELGALEAMLPQAVEVLAPGGRLAVISFHSLEDRLVKRFFQQESRDCVCPPEAPVCVCGHRATLRILTRKPVRPTASEVQSNPRARSARLRLAEKR